MIFSSEKLLDEVNFISELMFWTVVLVIFCESHKGFCCKNIRWGLHVVCAATFETASSYSEVFLHLLFRRA